MSKDDFTSQYLDVATKAGEQLGVDPQALLAQWGLETGWGKSVIPGTNNLGNIKDFSGKGVEATDNATKSRDRYRAYSDVNAFADDYVNLIKRRYPAAVGQKTAQGFAEALKKGGYAEDPEYVQKITTLAGADYVPTETKKSIKDSYDSFISKAVQDTIIRPTSRPLFQASVEGAQFDRQVKEESRPTGFEQFGGAMAGSTDHRIIGGIVDRIWGEKFAPVDGYKPDLKALPLNADSELVDDYANAKSPQAAEAVLKRFDEEQFRRQTVMDRGAVNGIALSIAAEGTSVSNWVAPFAAARGLSAAGRGSLVLARQGRTAASVGSAVVENVLSGTALEAVAQTMEGRVNGQDLLVSLVADSLLGVVGGAAGVRGVQRAESLVARAAESATAHEASLAVRAEQRIGTGAQAGELRQVMQQLEKEDVQGVVRSAMGEVPAERKLIQEDLAKKATPVAEPTDYAKPGYTKSVETRGTADRGFNDKVALGIFKATDDFAERQAQMVAINATPGVHLTTAVADSAVMQRYAKAIESLRSQMLPDVAIHLADVTGLNKAFDGVAGVIKPGVGLIAVKPGGGMRAVLHEFGHVVFQHKLSKASEEERQAMYAAWEDWRKTFTQPGNAQESMLGRGPVSAVGDANRNAAYLPALEGKVTSSLKAVFEPGLFGGDKAKADKFASYFSNFDEFSAEQFVKHVESLATGEATGTLSLPSAIINAIKTIVESALDVFRKAKDSRLIAPNASFSKFFDSLVAGDRKAGMPALNLSEDLAAMATPAKPADVANEVLTDPDAVKFGLTTVPLGTAAERKQAQAMLALHKQAAAWEVKNPFDDAWKKRVQNLADNGVFNVASIGLQMLKSPSPLVRMMASELLEDASGAAGKRQATASISKYMTERFMLGNAINDVQGAYSFWKKGKPGGLRDDLIGGNNWAQFNTEIAAEIEARRLAKGPVSQDPNIKAAADSLEAAYQRTANAQREAGTLGADGLPETSVGYMPHRMSPKDVINLTNEQSRILHDALTDQFVTIEGWDASFSDQLASSYMKRVRDRASGDYGSNIGGGNPGSASRVEEALRGMDLPEDTIKAHMDKFNKGAANFTKGRIELDLNKAYQTEQGEFKLLDIFETNQLELLRSQAGRASGDVALTKFGVRGKPGLKLLRDAMAYGEDGKRAGVKEAEAFDQMAAEFMNEPFGTQSGKFMERAMAANTLVRLGGIVFNQIAESINGIVHVGAARTMSSIASIPRLHAEIKALAAGKAVDNPFLTSIEHAGGAEFGTDAYKIIMPFDSPDHAFPTYGQDTLTLTDRLLRGGGYLQSKLSGWKYIHSAQQRGMAEQIVRKMGRYLNEGKDDIALRDFGITADVQKALRSELGNIATFDAAGNLQRFDATKISDPAIREQVIQAVWRGTQQIIQGTFIGERGKWAHDGWMKMLTQFRSFSISSMEKQWGRQRNERGGAAAFGLLMGSMSIAAPVYMARVYANSVGRPDQQEYLDKNLAPENVARATLNYVAMSGMAGEFMDLMTSVLPESLGVPPTGGRPGVATDFVGNYVLPASSLVNDMWKYAQSDLSLEDAAKLMPMSRLPFLVPLVNSTKD